MLGHIGRIDRVSGPYGWEDGIPDDERRSKRTDISRIWSIFRRREFLDGAKMSRKKN